MILSSKWIEPRGLLEPPVYTWWVRSTGDNLASRWTSEVGVQSCRTEPSSCEVWHSLCVHGIRSSWIVGCPAELELLGGMGKNLHTLELVTFKVTDVFKFSWDLSSFNTESLTSLKLSQSWANLDSWSFHWMPSGNFCYSSHGSLEDKGNPFMTWKNLGHWGVQLKSTCTMHDVPLSLLQRWYNFGRIKGME